MTIKFRTWETCIQCKGFIMFNGFHWVHRNGTARCKGGNAKPVTIHTREIA